MKNGDYAAFVFNRRYCCPVPIFEGRVQGYDSCYKWFHVQADDGRVYEFTSPYVARKATKDDLRFYRLDKSVDFQRESVLLFVMEIS